VAETKLFWEFNWTQRPAWIRSFAWAGTQTVNKSQQRDSKKEAQVETARENKQLV